MTVCDQHSLHTETERCLGQQFTTRHTLPPFILRFIPAAPIRLPRVRRCCLARVAAGSFHGERAPGWRLEGTGASNRLLVPSNQQGGMGGVIHTPVGSSWKPVGTSVGRLMVYLHEPGPPMRRWPLDHHRDLVRREQPDHRLGELLARHLRFLRLGFPREHGRRV